MARVLIVLIALTLSVATACSASHPEENSNQVDEATESSETVAVQSDLSEPDAPDSQAILPIDSAIELNADGAIIGERSGSNPDEITLPDSMAIDDEELLALPGWDELEEHLKGVMRVNQVFRREHPEIVAGHSPKLSVNPASQHSRAQRLTRTDLIPGSRRTTANPDIQRASFSVEPKQTTGAQTVNVPTANRSSCSWIAGKMRQSGRHQQRFRNALAFAPHIKVP